MCAAERRGERECVGVAAGGHRGALTRGGHIVRPLRLHLPVHPSTPGEVRRQLRRWLDALGWPREHAEDLLLAVDEAVSNAVEHAYPDPIPAQTHRDGPRVELCVSDTTATDDTHRVVVSVTDQGRWKPRAVSPGSRGRGLQMMRALAESLDVTATGSGTRVTMISRAVQISRRRAAAATKWLGDAGTLLLLAWWMPSYR
jgi:anti-sigma regulatory factor (Ser/Thr protein kinase)